MGAGLLALTRVPTDASFLVDLLPAYAVVGVGLGFAEVSVQIASETSREMGGALGLAVLVSIALSSTPEATEAFHRSVLVAAIFAVAGAAVAFLLLRPTERAVSAPVDRPHEMTAA